MTPPIRAKIALATIAAHLTCCRRFYRPPRETTILHSAFTVPTAECERIAEAVRAGTGLEYRSFVGHLRSMPLVTVYTSVKPPADEKLDRLQRDLSSTAARLIGKP